MRTETMKDVFGDIEKPGLAAAAVFNPSQRQELELRLHSQNGMTISMDELEGEMNRCTRALISLGVDTGDRIAVWGLDFADQLTLFLAVDQIGVHLIDLSRCSDIQSFRSSLLEQGCRVIFLGPRAEETFGQGFLSELGFESKTVPLEYAVSENIDTPPHAHMLPWQTFMNLEKYTTDWELKKLRVI